MPHCSITNSEKGDNKGSSRALVYYLEKENYLDQSQRQLKPASEREYFFSESEDKVTPSQVINHVDSRTKKTWGKRMQNFTWSISPLVRMN